MYKFEQIRDTRVSAIFIIILSSLLQSNAKNTTDYSSTCRNIHYQNFYSTKDISGFWYGIEFIEYSRTNYRTLEAKDPDSCIKIDLLEETKDNVYLTWRETNLYVTYQFHIKNNLSRGKWTSLGSQEVAEKPSNSVYEQFAGNVFVVNASRDATILTFCSPSKLFTLVLSRTHVINSTKLENIHKLLRQPGMPRPEVFKRYCENNAYMIKSQNFPIILMVSFVFKILCYNS